MERNGLLKYDRSKKIMGYDEIAYGGDMSINYIVAPEYVGFDNAPITTLTPGGTYSCNIGFINWTWHDTHTGPFTLKWRVDGVDSYGNKVGTLDIPAFRGQATIDYSPYIYRTEPMSFTVPNEARFNRFAGTVTAWIEDGEGNTIAKNFNNFKVIASGTTAATEQLADNSYVIRATSPTDSANSGSLAGTRVGYLSYEYEVPANFELDGLKSLRLFAEIAASRKMSTSNRTAHRAQTAEGYETPSDVTITINGHPVNTVFIPDSPIDIRNILTLDPTQDSAGKPTPSSAPDGFGYMVDIDLDKALVETLKNELKTDKTLTVRYEVLDTAEHKNGLRAYTDTNGRYPVSPSIMLNPPELYYKAGAIEDGALVFDSPLPNSNYSVEAAVTGSTAAISAGYNVAVNGNSISVTGKGIDKSVVSDSAIEKIKVTFFEEQVRIYVNDNPHYIIDAYGNALASTDVAVAGALANVKVLPETFGEQPGLALSSYFQDDVIVAKLRNNNTANTPVTLIVAAYDGSGKLAGIEIDNTLTVNTNETLSKTFALKPSEYPGCKFIVYAWEPDTYIPLVYRSQVN